MGIALHIKMQSYIAGPRTVAQVPIVQTNENTRILDWFIKGGELDHLAMTKP